eukprot:242370-Hanusia_phi.AAC.1
MPSSSLGASHCLGDEGQDRRTELSPRNAQDSEYDLARTLTHRQASSHLGPPPGLNYLPLTCFNHSKDTHFNTVTKLPQKLNDGPVRSSPARETYRRTTVRRSTTVLGSAGQSGGSPRDRTDDRD